MSQKEKNDVSETSDPKPKWPEERSFDRYNELTGLNITQYLGPGGTWIDIGAGARARALSELLGNTSVNLVAVATHPMAVPEGIDVIYGKIPDDSVVLERYKRQARLVTDVYGAISYAEDPLRVLIYESLLLGPSGKLVGVTEVKRLGDETTWRRIASFFGEFLGLRVTIEPFETFGDAVQHLEYELRIDVESQDLSAPFEKNEVDELYTEALRVIGKPSKSKILWQSRDSLAKIYQVDYKI